MCNPGEFLPNRRVRGWRLARGIGTHRCSLRYDTKMLVRAVPPKSRTIEEVGLCGAVELGLRPGSQTPRLGRFWFSHRSQESYWRQPGLFNLCFPASGVFSTNMVSKKFIALPLVVPLHFIE